MKLERTFEHGEIKIVFRNTLKHTSTYSVMSAVVPEWDEQSDKTRRDNFLWICAHIKTHAGLAWKPALVGDDAKTLEKKYQGYFDGINQELELALIQELNALHAPIADPLDKPTRTLTDKELADPNS